MRGEIYARERKRQIVSFRGMVWGNISPTDIDCLVDFDDNAFAFAELKLRGAKLVRGQTLAFTRAVDKIAQTGCGAALFVAFHDVEDTRMDIEADICLVKYVYEGGVWSTHEEPWPLRAAVDAFLRRSHPVLAERLLPPDAPLERVSPPHVDLIWPKLDGF